MASKLKVGLVGASPDGSSWGARAHVPALKSLPDFELKAICTAHEDTARKAAESFGAELAFHDYNAMFASPEIDLVSVAVRVPKHHEITMAALRAGKNVYCEWPLGANLQEAEEMASTARDRGLITMVGLQARSDPVLQHLRRLVGDGYLGKVLTVHMTIMTPGALERPSSRIWQADVRNGANTITITGGHSIDALCFCLGEFVEVSARVGTQIPQVGVSDTGETANVTSPDNARIAGVLEGGALASVHVATVPYHGSGGWHLEAYGTEGTLAVGAGQANYNPAPIRVMAGRGRDPLAEMVVPDDFLVVSEGTPMGPAYNVAQAYTRFGGAIQKASGHVDPDFDVAVRLHRLLAAIEQSSTTGRAVELR